MNYADTYRLAHLLDTLLAAVYANDHDGPCELDDDDVAAIHEAHGIALRACAAEAARYVLPDAIAAQSLTVATARHGGRRKRPQVVSGGPCKICLRTGRMHNAMPDGRPFIYCAECHAEFEKRKRADKRTTAHAE